MRKIGVVFFIIYHFLYSPMSAQLPCSNTNIVYIQSGSNIYDWDITLPMSATNPSLNTISLPSGAGGLAVSTNLNGPGPSPTFYTSVSGNYWYYDGATWVNTGHSCGSTAAVNSGGGGNFIYNMVGATGEIYKYDGTGNASLLLTVPGFSGGGPYDIVGDCNGNFYILRTNATSWLRLYDPNGNLLNQWTVTGASGTAGGGFAIVGSQIWYMNGSGFNGGTINGMTNVTFSPAGSLSPAPSDMAVCPVGGIGTGVNDTVYYCIGDPPVHLNSSQSNVIQWSVASGPAVLNPAGNSADVTSSGGISTIYAVGDTMNSANVCGGGIDTFTFIAPTATVSAGADFTINGCGVYEDTLKGNLLNTIPGLTYNIDWQPAAFILSGGNTLNPIAAPVSQTTFTLTVSTPPGEGGCSWIDSVTVDINNLSPDAQFTTDVVLGCDNDTVQFTFTGTIVPGGNPQFFWDFDDGNFSTLQDPQHVYYQPGIYDVWLYVTDGPCIDSFNMSLDLNHIIQAEFSFVPDDVPIDSVCLGEAVLVISTSTPQNILKHIWDYGDGTVDTNFIQNPHVYQNSGLFPVTLTVMDTLGCVDSMVQYVYVDEPAFVALNASPLEICVGEPVSFIDTVSPNAYNSFYDFDDGIVMNNIHNPQHTYDVPGVYDVTLTGEYYICPDQTKSVSIRVRDYPEIDLGPDAMLCPDLSDPLVLTNLKNPSAVMHWSTGEDAASIMVNTPGTYWAQAKNGLCSSSDTIWVQRDCYINIPNSFSPNGDGLNDYFLPRQLLSAGVILFDMKLFNRWGELVFKTDKTDGRGWDGKYGGKDQPVGTYIYLMDVQFKNGIKKKFQGNVTLLR